MKPIIDPDADFDAFLADLREDLDRMDGDPFLDEDPAPDDCDDESEEYDEAEEYDESDGPEDDFALAPPARASRSHAARRSAPRRIGRGILLALGVLLLLIIAGALAVVLMARAPEPVTEVPAAEEESSSSWQPVNDPTGGYATEAQAVQSTVASRREGCYTLLVLGKDKIGTNTDTMIVCVLDTEAGTLSAVSLPRDTMVNVPWDAKKINSVYIAEGVDGLMDQVEMIFGYRPDDYAIVNVDAFVEAIDAIGGVDFDVPIRMTYCDYTQDLYIDLQPGYQHLDGYNTMCVFRFRQSNYGDGETYKAGDLDRMETQHKLLSAIANQLLSVGNIPNFPTLLSIISDNVETSLSMGNIIWYAMEILKLPSNGINFYTIPVEMVDKGSLSYVYIVDDIWIDLLNCYMNPTDHLFTGDDLQIITLDDDGELCMTDGSEMYTNFY